MLRILAWSLNDSITKTTVSIPTVFVRWRFLPAVKPNYYFFVNSTMCIAICALTFQAAETQKPNGVGPRLTDHRSSFYTKLAEPTPAEFDHSLRVIDRETLSNKTKSVSFGSLTRSRLEATLINHIRDGHLPQTHWKGTGKRSQDISPRSPRSPIPSPTITNYMD